MKLSSLLLINQKLNYNHQKNETLQFINNLIIIYRAFLQNNLALIQIYYLFKQILIHYN